MQQDKESSGLRLFFAHAWPSSASSLSWSEEWMMSCGAAWWNPNCQPRSQSRGGRGAPCWSVCRDAWEWAAHRWPVARSGCLPDLLGRREKCCHGNGQLQGDHRGNGRDNPQRLHRSWRWGKWCKTHHWKPSPPWEGCGGGQSQKSGSKEGEGSALTQSFHSGGSSFSLNPQHDEIPGSECVVYINI